MEGEERMWYILQHGVPKLRIEKRGAFDSERAPGNRHYLDYIVTDRPTEEINWDTENETQILLTDKPTAKINWSTENET